MLKPSVAWAHHELTHALHACCQVVATYITSLRSASLAAEEQLGGGRGGRKRALRVEFGEGGPSVGLASASATSSIQSSIGSFVRAGSSQVQPMLQARLAMMQHRRGV